MVSALVPVTVFTVYTLVILALMKKYKNESVSVIEKPIKIVIIILCAAILISIVVRLFEFVLDILDAVKGA